MCEYDIVEAVESSESTFNTAWLDIALTMKPIAE